MTPAEARERAQIIREQIGVLALAAIGARDLVAGAELGTEREPGLMMRVGPARGRGFAMRKLIVTLTPMDTYRVALIAATDRALCTWAPVATETDVYAEDLARIIRDVIEPRLISSLTQEEGGL